ncbi:ubiquitin-related domain-containing protein [Chytriomyces sp. MP71]|nr:ubiquitin-related domain-containing protein [Chytriomyces sp. MP71]
MHVFVKSFISNQSTLVLESLQPTDTVKMLKTRIQEQLLIPTDHQRLIHSGIQLGEDHKTLDSYKVADGSTIHLVLRLIGGSLDGSFTGSPTNATPVLGGEFVVTNATFTSNFSTAPTTPSADLNLNNLGEMLVLPQQQETPGGAIGNEISEAVPPPTQVVEQVPASPNAHAARMAALRNGINVASYASHFYSRSIEIQITKPSAPH